MKINTNKSLQRLIIKKPVALFFFLVLLVSHSAYGQKSTNRFEIKAGYGYYQGINIGFGYFYTKNLEAGCGFGSYMGLPPFDNKKHFNIHIENTLHFGSPNKQHVGGWYFNQQLMYWEEKASDTRWQILSLGLNIGKTIVITEHLGLDLETGPAFNLTLDVERDPLADMSGWMWPVLYNGRIQLTYKF